MQLENYEGILSGEKKAKFLEAKNYRLDFEEDFTLEELWQIHGEAVENLKCGKFQEKGKSCLLDLKREIAWKMLASCEFCERRCRADRKAGKRGVCGVLGTRIASEFLHFGEEPMLVPSHTVFFAGCTFKCVFCQNWDISQYPENGVYLSPEKMAAIVRARHTVSLNVNWVGGDPTPNLPFILDVLHNLDISLPQIWNSNMYMSTETMNLLDGIVDLYLADFKYGNNDCAENLSGVKNYMEIVLRNHKLANQQCDLLIRHLVMPGHVDCCSLPMLDLISRELENKNLMLNIMDQYRPEYKAHEIPGMDRRITNREYQTVLKHAKSLGFSCVP
ncbi:MAG: radical SAM protein [Thermoplasmata archaeon]|nr:radical SAM protein [Thermoplasmata archaeon]